MHRDDRPDPDALLLRLQQVELRARRGKLRVIGGEPPQIHEVQA
jgi:hypothetical protein